ncbi:MAG: hypothetical protein OEQ14_05395 [Gammaproteobacteria bacterium]|nr:hypothetical protein [Gammaproteobacteria bacterium]
MSMLQLTYDGHQHTTALKVPLQKSVAASFITAGMYPMGLMVTSIIWRLFEVPIAATAGAWLYQESKGSAD